MNRFVDGRVYLAKHLCRTFITDAKDDTISFHEVVPAMSFTQEFRIVGNTYVLSNQIRNDFLQGGRRRNRRLDNQYLIFIGRSHTKCLVDCAEEISEISLPVFTVWRSNTVIDAITLFYSHFQFIDSDGMKPFVKMTN